MILPNAHHNDIHVYSKGGVKTVSIHTHAHTQNSIKTLSQWYKYNNVNEHKK